MLTRCVLILWVAILMLCILRHRKHDYANYDQTAPNFGTAHKTIQRLCTKFEVIWTNENRVIGQRS